MRRLLEVKNLTVGKIISASSKEEKVLKAVKNISFTLEEGEIAGLAGESGCGKTMTALAISNLLPQSFQITEGEIFLENKSLTSMSEKEMCRIRGNKIGFIFQDSKQALNPLMKVGNQITEMLLLINNEQIQIKEKSLQAAAKYAALELLSSLGFEEPQKIFDAYPHQLSGGMCQRVMAAIAVICQPKLLLADEPSSSLDEESQERILSLLLEMNQKYKTTVLIISHDISLIKKFCSRFIVMYAGKIVEEGPSKERFSPLHPYTRALINAIPSKEKRGTELENISGKVPSIEDDFKGCPFAPRCSDAQKICTEAFPQEKYFNTDEECEIHRKVFCTNVVCTNEVCNFPLAGEKFL
ncbi:MAG: ABC transporter ATP-binding protein [Treponema sp.]|nr:ABC transporter ATP-binding protein [Treponema sp.]MCL2252029.1 ABC transporter ATP-binding protein [Treponema sp.]